MNSKSRERSHLSLFRLGNQFAFKLKPTGKALAVSCLFALASQSAYSQSKLAVNALPTGGKVVAGAATISSTQTATSATMNVNQTSQRAVINWDTFNVGKNATVNFNQPNSQAVILNRVTSASASLVDGVIRANGRVMLVNPNGVNFGKGAEVHAAGVVASTLDISNKDFMDGKSTFTGNGQGKIVNEGKIVATDPNGYIALLAPEVRNQGFLIARKGTGSTIAMASGEKITLDFRGSQLIGVTVDKATYNGLIENKRVVEVNGGLVVLAAGTARELMASLISNTGKISANAIVDNGGVIDIVASNVVQAGTISANGNGANSTGGQINIVGENITVAANSKTTATGQAGGGSIQIGVGRTVAANAATSSAANSSVNTTQTAAQILAANPAAMNLQAKTVTVEEGAIINASAITQGNGGAIVIWSQVKTIVNGVLSAVGGYLGGNGGLVETSSAGSVVLGKNLSVNTGAPKGSSGLWFLDPIDLTIDGSAAGVISAALTNNNVSITVAGNICPTLGSCTQNGTGSLTIASGANILKDSGNLTTLTLTSSGIFNLNADISGQNLNVIINSSIAYLNVGTSINANQVTVQAQSIFSYGSINAGNASNLGNAISLLAQAIYVSGGLRVGSNPATSSNSNTSTSSISYNGSLIRQQDLPDFLVAANQTSVNLDQVYSAIAANQSSYIPAGVNQITLTGTQSITIAATAQLLANGTFGGSIIAAAPQINLLAPVQNNTPIAQGSGSLIQANGNNGPGGIIALTAANDFNINSATISANGSTDGGSIRLISSAGNLLLSNSLIQTNGGSGRGGSLGVSAANDTTINGSTLEATGFTKGGSIMVGYDSAGKSLPFSQSTTIDAATILSANQTDGTNSTDGGLLETSGGTLVQLASINAGRGGMWLLDPYDYIIGAPEAANISALLDAGTSVSISTLNASHNFNGQVVNGVSGDGTIYVNSAIAAQYSSSSSLTFTATTIWISANITTHGAQTYNGNVLVLGAVTLKTYGADLTVTGTISGGYAANTVLSLLGNGGWSTISPTGVVDSGTLQQNTPFAMAGGTLTYTGNTETSTGSGVFTSGYTWQPLYSSSGSVLVVGAGGGGGARSGNGGSGGGVYSSALQTFNSSTTYTMSVGIGGYGGDLGTTPSGLSGGSSSIQGIVTAAGGAGGSTMNMSPSTMGGSANAGARASTSGLGADGIQSSITGSLIYYGGGGGGGGYGGGTTGTAPYYYGYGGIPSTRLDGFNNNPPGQCPACDRNGNPGQPNTGMGGGGGLYSYPYVGTGGTGGNGVVIVHAVSSADTQLTIANAGTVRLLGNVNGGVLNSLNISLGDCGGCATPVASITSTISGNITGNITLNLDSYSTRNKLLLSGQNNTFTGSINIYGGTLQAVSANSFGNANNIINMPTTLTTGDLPTIDLNGISMTGYTMRLQGAGTQTRGALINSSSTTAATFSGSVVLNGDASIGGPGTINLTGVVSQNGNTLSFVTSAKVSATNAANSLDTIIGSAAGNVQLASQTLVTIGNTSTGFTGDGSLSVYSSNGILVTKAISVSSGISLIASGLQAITINAPMIASAMRVIGVSAGVNSDGIAFGGNLVLSSSGDIFLSGSSMSPAGGRGVHLGAGTKIIATQNLSVIGYADGSGAGNTFGIASENNSGTLLFSGGNMLLAASTPNGVSGSTSLMSTNGAAIDIHTVIKSGGNLKITAAQIGLFGNGDTFGNNVSNVATDVAAVISSPHQSGVAIENYSGVTYSGVTYSNTVVAGNIEMAASGTDLGLYIGGSLLSTGGSISLNGTSTAGGTGVMVQVTYTEPKQIITQSSSAGDITITGTSSGTTNGTGIFLWSNGSNPIEINSAKSLTLVGWAAGSGTNYGIRTSGYGTLISAGEMVLAASTPNSRYGSAIRSTYNISAGSDLTFEGATQSGGAQYHSDAENQSAAISLTIAGSIGAYNGVSAGGIINIFGASKTNLAGDLTASDGHSQNYGVDVGHANLHAGGNINITGSAMGIGGGYGDYGNSGIVVGNIQAGGLLSLIGNSPDYTVYGGMTITSAGGISVTGTGSIDLRGSWTNTGANNGIVLLVSKDVSVESLNNSGSGGIRITGGAGHSAGDSAGGTIKGLGSITNTAGVVGLSLAAPSNNYAVEAAIGITSSNASTAQNVSYGKDAANFSTPNGYSITYTNGNFINYRQAFSTSYSVTVNNNYSAVYGTTTTSDYARTWFVNNSNVSLSIVGTAFGVNQQAALQSLRFGNPNDSSLNLNIVQSNTPIAQGTIFSVDGTTVNVQSNTKTYTITRAPLGISVTGAYNNSTTITPSSFSVYGLVNNEVINSLTSASVAFKDALAGNNYVTGIVIGTGTASMSNYQLNPLGRNITSNSTLQNMVTITPLAITVTGATASNKVYDGTTTATVNSTSAVLTGKISGDDLTLSMNSGSFMSPGVGNGISVTGAGSLQGASASNYTLGAILLSANITPAPLGVTVVGTYSNSTTIAPTSFTTTGLVNGETISSITSAIINNKNVSANGSNFVTSITIGNGTASLSNYSLTTSYHANAGSTQNIATLNAKTLTVSGTAVADKVYDGTTTAVLTNGVLNGVNNGDTVTLTQAGTFSRAGVGTSLTVTAADTIGDTSGNYVLQQPQTLNASITPKVVSLSAAKTYDATTSLAGYVTISTGVGSETLTYTGATAYSANVSTNGTNYINAITLADGSNGGLANNYTLPTLNAANAPVTLTAKALNMSASKTYDSTTSLANAVTISGLIGSQTLNYSGATAHTANAGSTYIDAITVSDGTNGGLAGNYQIPTLTSAYTYNNVTITPKVVTLSANKVYDGTNNLAGAVSIGGLIGSQTLNYTGSTVSDVNVTTANKYITAMTLTDGNNGGLAANYVLPTLNVTNAPVAITARPLTVSGTTVPDKVYDGTTTTTLAGGTLVGVVGSEVVNLIQSGTFASANAGNNVAVVANDSLSGNAAVLSNYTLVQPTTTTGNIIRAPLTVTGTTVSNKVYDGTVTATLANGQLVGVIAADNGLVTLNQSGTFANANAGNSIAITATDSLAGSKAANYVLTQPTVAAANITPAPLGVSITNAVYQASTSLNPVGLNFTFTGLVNGETITALSSATVANANVSANGSNYVTVLTVGSGTANINNYSLNSAYSANANNVQNKVTLTPMTITVTGTTVPDKVYDGNTTTTLAGGQLNGVFANDSGQVSLNQFGTFASPNAGNNVAVVANDSLNLTGSAIGNYVLVQPTTTTGNIIKAPLGITVTGTYTGSNALQAAGINFTVNGLLNGETISTLASVSVYDKNVSANVNNFVTAITVGSGTASMNNYALTQAYNATAGNTQNTATILTTQLTVTGTALTTKVYDGTTAATLTGGVLVGIKGSDTVFLNQVGTFSDSNVGNGIAITAANTISGAAAVNYTLVQPTGLTGNITPKALTVVGTTVPTKVYDGTTATTLSGGQLVGLVANETLTLTQAGTFASANAGTGISVVANDSISGAGVSNYTLVQPTTTTGNITKTPLGVTVTGVYSGSTTITPTAFTVSGLQGSDTITALTSAVAHDANVATASNYVSAITIGSGTASMNNYALTQAYNTSTGNTQNTVTITPKILTVAGNKVYDGLTTGGAVTFGGLIGSQTLSYSNVAISDANVATANKYITSITLADGSNGGIASNYGLPNLTAASASNNATVTPLTISLVGNKTYDGTTSLTGAVTITGLVGSQTLGYTGATANSANVLGTNFINAITLTNGSNGGVASNYQLPNLTTAYTNNNVNITAKPITISGTKVYDATTDLTNAVTITGLVGNQTLTYTGATANSANVLTASYINAITFADGTNGGLASNYALPTLTGANTYNNATVTPAPLSLSGTKVYDGTTTGGNGTLNIGGLIGAQTLVSSNVTVNDPNVGNNKYVMAVTLADGTNGGMASNYALPSLTAASARNIGSITPKDLFITLSAQTKVYGDGIAQTSNTQDGSIGLPSVANQNGTANNTDATKPALSGIQYVNYTGNTANNSSAGFSVVGLVANDTVSTVNISSAGGALTANASVNGVSTYAIAASGAVGSGLSNYNINYVSNNYSVLTVTPRPLNVTVANATMAYGATALPNFTSTVAGLVNGDQANVTMSTAATPYANGLAGSASNVGAYAIVASSVSNPNYYAVSTNGTLTITPINLTITAATQGGPGSPILYGTPTVLKQTVIDNALTASGLTNGDYVSGATITYNGSQTISGTSAAGTYTGGLQIASATGSGLSNYNITYQAGNLIIGKAVLTVTAANDAKLQGQADPTNFNGVIFSGFRNGENTSVVNLNGLSITRTNSTVNAVGTYTGVLQVGGIDSPNYSIAFAPGDFTIVGPGQLLVRVAPVISQYGTAPVYANPTASYIPANVVNPTANSAVSLTASISAPGVVTVTDGTSSMNMNIAVANAVNSSSGNLVVGAYGLDSRVQPATSAGFASQFTSTVMVGGLTVTPKVLTFSDFGVSGVSKVYDGSTSMSNIGFAPATNVFIPSDIVNPVANGTFLDRNVGINKGYTVGVTFAGTDAANYVMSGGAIYTADGANSTNHGPANGSITQLNSVTYVGATTGGSWSDPNSWRVTNGATLGAIPDLANVANIIVNAGSTVVYDSGVMGPVVANLVNAGNVNFATNTNLTISMNISGPGSVTVSGTGQLSLSGNNTYTGNSIISNGSTLIAVSGNSIGAGNIQGLGGTFQGTPGAIFAQINATGSLRLASDITTTGNQTYGNLVVTQARTTLLSQNGNILINGTLDGSIANGNTLLVQAPTGTVSLRGSSGSILPINVLEIDSIGTYLYADVLTSDQQNYCGAGGCYSALTVPQISANYCATNDCYSKNNITSAYNLLAAGTGGSGDFAKNINLGQVYIGDNGQVGFLFNTYNAYATQAFGTTAPLFQNNPVYARTLISRDPMVNFGSFINDASANSIHTMQAAAIQVPGVNTPPTIQFNGVGNTQALFSLNALTQTVSAVNAFGGSIKNAADSTLKTLVNINFGSNAINLNNVNVITPTLNVVVPPNTGTFTAAGANITTNSVNVNGRPTIPAGARVTAYTPVTTSTGASSRAPVAPAFGSSRTATRIMAAISQQTKLDRKYDVEASVDIGDIETEDAPADKSDETDPKKKKKRTTS